MHPSTLGASACVSTAAVCAPLSAASSACILEGAGCETAATDVAVLHDIPSFRSALPCAYLPRFAKRCVEADNRPLDEFAISVLIAMAELRGPSTDPSIVGRAQVLAGIIRQDDPGDCIALERLTAAGKTYLANLLSTESPRDQYVSIANDVLSRQAHREEMRWHLREIFCSIDPSEADEKLRDLMRYAVVRRYGGGYIDVYLRPDGSPAEAAPEELVDLYGEITQARASALRRTPSKPN